MYSNTGGQASKATPITIETQGVKIAEGRAIAKFAASGRTQAKKNLGLMQMQYKNVYVSMGTNSAATVKAFNEAENYNGPYPPSRRRVAKRWLQWCDHHRVRALHRAGAPHEDRSGAPEGGGRVRPLPALELQPGDGQAQARLGGLRRARLCRPSASIRDKSDTVSFAKNAISKELISPERSELCAAKWLQGCENRFKQLVKKVGAEKAEAMLQTAEQGFKENYALIKKLSEM